MQIPVSRGLLTLNYFSVGILAENMENMSACIFQQQAMKIKGIRIFEVC